MNIISLVGILCFVWFSSGCSLFKKEPESVRDPASLPPKIVSKPVPQPEKTYSSTPNYIASPERDYKRVTKDTLSAEAKLQQEAGSLWVMKGQGGFLFAQNHLRSVGDAVNVKLAGTPQKDLQAKAKRLADLLLKIEEKRVAYEDGQEKKRLEMLAEREKKQRELAEKKAGKKKDKKGEVPEEERKIASEVPDKIEGEEGEAQKTIDPKVKALQAFKFDVKSIPTRITKRTMNGNYEVEGSKGFLIGNDEYRVILKGLASSDDIDGGEISAAQLADAKFDIVSTLRKGDSIQ